MAKNSIYAAYFGPGNSAIYTDWAQCEKAVKGQPGVRYKGFHGPEAMKEAQTFLEACSGTKGYPAVQQEDVEAEPLKADMKPVSAKKESIPAPSGIKLPDGPYAFVDGSFNSTNSRYGYGGFLCVRGRKYPLMGHGDDPEMASMHNVAGEIMGSMAAVKLAEQMKLRELTILYDYKGIEEWAEGRWKANRQGTKEYQATMLPMFRKVQLNFVKVPAHTGIEGNEMADVMAKRSVGIPLTKKQEVLLTEALSYGKRNGCDLSSIQSSAEDSYNKEI